MSNLPSMFTSQYELERALGIAASNNTNGATKEDELTAAIIAKADQGAGAVPKSELTWDKNLLRGALLRIPSDDYMMWINIAMALKGEMMRSAGAIPEEEALEFFLQWSALSPKYEETFAIQKWNGLEPTGEKGIASIFWIARHEYEWKGERKLSWSDEAPANYNGEQPYLKTEDSDNGDGNFNFNEPPPPPQFADEIDELNWRHFVVFEQGKTRVMSERYDRMMKRRYLTSSSFEDFKNYYSNRYVEVRRAGRNGQAAVDHRPLGAYWLGSPRRRQYEDIVFAPGMALNENCYNLWRGWTVKPEVGDWSLLKEHIHNNICSGNDEWSNYFLNWLAFAVQNPDKQAGVAIVLRGDRGTGKGTAVSYFGDLFGQHFIHVTSSRQVTGNFNAHLRDAIFLYSDEAVYAGNKSEESTLKGLITEQYLTIEAKGKDVITVKNNLHVIIASNNDWAIPAGVDERRFFVLNVSNKRKQDTAYFREIKKQMNNGGRSAMLYELMNRDITKFNIYNVPKTGALWEQKVQSMDPVMKWWLGKLLDGRILDYFPEFDHPIPKELVFRDYVESAQAAGVYHRGTETEIGIRLSKFCGAPGYPKTSRGLPDQFLKELLEVKSKDGRVKMWTFPPLEECRAAFESQCGHKIDWKNGILHDATIQAMIKETTDENFEVEPKEDAEMFGVDYGGDGEAM